jgi:hypothetical protein
VLQVSCGGSHTLFLTTSRKVCVRERERETESNREWTWWAHTGGGKALAYKTSKGHSRLGRSG